MALLSHLYSEIPQFPDNSSTISTSPTSTSPRNSHFGGGKSKIWLKFVLRGAKLILILSPILAPLTSYAGVFSFIGDLVSNKEADAGVTTRSSEVLGVLQANVGPSSTAGTGGADIAMVDGSALMQETGMYGTQADIQDSKSTQIS